MEEINFFMSKHASGKSIGNYLLEDTIGSGTFGKVKIGRHGLSGMKVAVKILEKQRIVDSADVERVSREIHILKQVRHPHIVRLYEIVESPKQLFLITEFAAGGELFDYIVRKKRLDEVEACKFFRQLVSAISHLHSLGIAHRDLKPENLLLDASGDIKVVDFGLSNTFEAGQNLRTACGSPCYASPEMISGVPYDPQRSDVWSIGVVLYAMVCGFLPFEHPSTSKLYEMIIAGNYSLPSHLSRDLRILIKGILTTDPVMRMSIDDIRSNAWFSSLVDITVSNTPHICGIQSCKCCRGISNIPDTEQCVLDEEVLAELSFLEIPLDYVIKCIRMNKHNHATTAYYLLAERKRLGLGSLARPKRLHPVETYTLATPQTKRQMNLPGKQRSTVIPLRFSNIRNKLAPSTVAAIATARRFPHSARSAHDDDGRRSNIVIPLLKRVEDPIAHPGVGARSARTVPRAVPMSARPDLVRPSSRSLSRSQTRRVSPAFEGSSVSRSSSAIHGSSKLLPTPNMPFERSSFARPTASSAARSRGDGFRPPFGSTARRLNVFTPSPPTVSGRLPPKALTAFSISKPFAIPISSIRALPARPVRNHESLILSSRNVTMEHRGDKHNHRGEDVQFREKVPPGRRLITTR
jgi:serine/threonine protein kinase